MEKIILDFTKCKRAKNAEELYQVIRDAFKYPYSFGDNPNALWDAMRWYWEEDVHLILYGVHELEYLYLKKEMEYIIEVFEDVHEDTPNVTFEIVS